MLSLELNYIQVKFGVNPSISFEVTGQNVILSDGPYETETETDHLD